VTECTRDAQITLQDFQNGFAKISHGLKTLNIPEIQAGMKGN
jgi:hypothetical protein